MLVSLTGADRARCVQHVEHPAVSRLHQGLPQRQVGVGAALLQHHVQQALRPLRAVGDGGQEAHLAAAQHRLLLQQRQQRRHVDGRADGRHVRLQPIALEVAEGN